MVSPGTTSASWGNVEPCGNTQPDRSTCATTESTSSAEGVDQPLASALAPSADFCRSFRRCKSLCSILDGLGLPLADRAPERLLLPAWRTSPMHFEKTPEADPLPPDTGPWWKLLNRYHWYVFVVAALGWLFDCMDQRIFMVSRQDALTELLGYDHDKGGRLIRVGGSPLPKDEATA